MFNKIEQKLLKRKTQDDSRDERIKRFLNEKSAQAPKLKYDPRFTPLVLNQPLYYLANDSYSTYPTRSDSCKAFRASDNLYIFERQLEAARSSHSLQDAIELEVDDQVYGLSLGNLRYFIHDKIKSEIENKTKETQEALWSDISDKLGLRTSGSKGKDIKKRDSGPRSHPKRNSVKDLLYFMSTDYEDMQSG